MGPHEIINFAPVVKLTLRFGEIAELAVAQQLQAQGAMEALVLALGLWMTWTAMKDGHPQAHQPHFKRAVSLHPRAPERRSVVGQNPQRQAVDAERRAEPRAGGYFAFIGA